MHALAHGIILHISTVKCNKTFTPSAKNAWLTFLTFDLLIKIVILHALLAVSMSNIFLVIKQSGKTWPVRLNVGRWDKGIRNEDGTVRA